MSTSELGRSLLIWAGLYLFIPEYLAFIIHYGHLFFFLFFPLQHCQLKSKPNRSLQKWVTRLCAKSGNWPLAACSHCVQFHHNILLPAASTLLPSLTLGCLSCRTQKFTVLNAHPSTFYVIVIHWWVPEDERYVKAYFEVVTFCWFLLST